jgi:hypothetical protein
LKLIERLAKVALLCPTPVNIYLEEIITKRQEDDVTGIPPSTDEQLTTLLTADGQMIISNTEGNLQKAAHKLNQIIAEYGLTICREIKINGI